MRTSMIHAIAISWTSLLNLYANREGKDLQKMILGMEILLHNIPKLILMVTIASLLGILIQTLVTWLPFAYLRRYASGLHASNSITCMIMTLLMFVAIPFALQGMYVNEAVFVLALVAVGVGMYMYAPADTVARPIVGKKKRVRLKRKAVTACVIICLATLIFQNEMFYVLVAIGCIYALCAIMPLTYKILKRSENNYEQYE